ncbi:2-oxo-4-hydroxy-4-carboxy-5-ureidoimidazoline decarboxylase [Ferrovibrio xuzhouensis]|uniref:2-oxo-4-hydroxy-4-carboxy-5-ureidoimidazoline decarboxylase n=1 Tax=Ferrovibrio xuzhouensis TaxID=1576914 RepID=A0ABV7VGH5_9PROT
MTDFPLVHTALTLADLNRIAAPDFVIALDGIFEHSPWIAERAVVRRPFGSLDALHGALVAAMWAATPDEQRDLLCAHPELAGREADAGTLTDHSTGEQDSAGLTRLSPGEKQRILQLNATYRDRHGFPFIIAVKLRTKRQIFAEFERRLNNTPDVEFGTALAEVGRIARIRLDALLSAAPVQA